MGAYKILTNLRLRECECVLDKLRVCRRGAYIKVLGYVPMSLRWMFAPRAIRYMTFSVGYPHSLWNIRSESPEENILEISHVTPPKLIVKSHTTAAKTHRPDISGQSVGRFY